MKIFKTIIKTAAPTPAFPAVAIAMLYYANGRPVLDRYNSRVFGTGATIEEAIEALNQIRRVRDGEVRTVRA
jgi:hypothetical protein